MYIGVTSLSMKYLPLLTIGLSAVKVGGKISQSLIPLRIPTRLFSVNSQPFPMKQLRYNGVEINLASSEMNINTDDFELSLSRTLITARAENRSSVYLKIPSRYGAVIPVASKAGFVFHHAEGDQATMLLWLDSTPCKVPPFATHHIGVGAAVLHGTKLLVVREKDRGMGLISWKLPGGLVDLHEELSEAAEREVLEETGVRASFVEILGLRHSMNVQFGRNDVYMVCRLDALSEEIIVDDEIDDAKWIELDEFYANNKYPMLTPIAKLLIGDDYDVLKKLLNTIIDRRHNRTQ